MENETTYYAVNPEQAEKTFDLSQKYVFRPIIYMIIGFCTLIILIGFLIVPIAFCMLLIRLWRYMFTKITISPSKIAISEGYTSRTREIMIDKIEKVEVIQGIMDKMMDTGTVSVRAAGNGILMMKVDYPFQMKDKIVNLIESRKEH